MQLYAFWHLKVVAAVAACVEHRLHPGTFLLGGRWGDDVDAGAALVGG